MIDLHTHSNASDGQYSPCALMELAAESGVTAIALTDHDTVSGIEEARGAAARLGVEFFAGIEISSKSELGSAHILGYNIDPNAEKLAGYCKWATDQRRRRADKIFEVLEKQGVSLTRESVEKYAGGTTIARPHFARAMVEAGYVKDVPEAFEKYLEAPEIKGIKWEKLSPKQSIELIRSAGGLPVLAHPIQLKTDRNGLRAFVKRLAEQGLAGLECYYSTNSPENTEEYLKIAKENGLYATAGSDFHGEKVKPSIKIGSGINDSLCVERLEFLNVLRTSK